MSKIYELLLPIQNVLESVVVFLYQNVIASYGIVIILLTIIVRLILTPLTITQTRSMARMQKIQPQLKELQKKYKDDKQKLQQETMAFYKENNVNPLAGCLPLILQMPVFFALFQTLRNPTDKVTSVVNNFKFLWMDLDKPDPYYILVILMVATMFLSTKLSTTDPKQSKIMYILPVVFGFISFRFEAGILVYWVTTNVWSIGQQWVVNKIVKRDIGKGGKKEEEKDELSQVEITEIARKKKKRRKKK
ncbi:MAG: YidC/Oxa1 family membrane protein insertase [Actinomycetota bacterium]|nr:MAG: YidC/Oxa1 family membrane protein insertase [Actinomycetota bacterium]